jgi:hypothetical protein
MRSAQPKRPAPRSRDDGLRAVALANPSKKAQGTLLRQCRLSTRTAAAIGRNDSTLVLDFDNAAAYARWQRKNRKLTATTPVVQSPNGFHVYLKTKEPTISSSLHFGFRRAGHVKALGGYVLSPPSKFENGNSYRWLPGQSPFEIVPQTIGSLESLSLRPVSPLKAFYDRLLNRGGFEPN